MNNFSWGFPENAVVDPELALVNAAADYAETGLDEAPTPEFDEVDTAEDDDEDDDYTERALPPFFEAFRKRARINTYTVIGPGMTLDEYPFFTPPPENYPTCFGPNSVRTRTLAR